VHNVETERARREYKQLEGCGRREKRHDQDGQEAVSIEPGSGPLPLSWRELLATEQPASAPHQPIHHERPQHRPRSRKDRIQRGAVRVKAGKINQECIVDARKRKKRGVQEGYCEQSGAPVGHEDFTQLLRYTFDEFQSSSKHFPGSEALLVSGPLRLSRDFFESSVFLSIEILLGEGGRLM